MSAASPKARLAARLRKRMPDPAGQTAVLTHRRIYIMPNRRGLALGALLAIQILVSTNYNSNLGFMLAFLLASTAVLGILHAFRNLSGIALRSGRAEPVFAGERASFEIFLDNPSNLPRIALHIGLRGHPQQVLHLPAGDRASAKIAVATARRGWHDLPTVTVSSGFPLGLYHAWSPVDLAARVLVYPAPAKPGMPFPEAPGERGDRHAQADDFQGFRGYQPGDSPRRIHWKSLAKGQGVHVREYRGGANRELTLDWADAPGATIEAKLAQLCRWALDAEQAGLSYGLRLPGTPIESGAGPAHLRRCLESLATFG